MAAAVAIFAIAMLVGLTTMLVGADLFRERHAMLMRRIDEVLDSQ